MDINKQFSYIVYVDLCTSFGQMEIATLTTILSMYHHMHKDESLLISTYLWLVVKVVITLITVMISLREIQCARHLTRAGIPAPVKNIINILRKRIGVTSLDLIFLGYSQG